MTPTPAELAAVDLPPLTVPEPLTRQLIRLGLPNDVAERISDAYMLNAEKLRVCAEKTLRSTYAKLAALPRCRDTIPLDRLQRQVFDCQHQLYRETLRKWAQEAEDLIIQAPPSMILASKSPRSSIKKPKRQLNLEYLPLFEFAFEKDRFPSREDIQHLAHISGISYRQVYVWFQNRRCRQASRVKSRRIASAPKTFEEMINRLDPSARKALSRSLFLTKKLKGGIADRSTPEKSVLARNSSTASLVPEVIILDDDASSVSSTRTVSPEATDDATSSRSSTRSVSPGAMDDGYSSDERDELADDDSFGIPVYQRPFIEEPLTPLLQNHNPLNPPKTSRHAFPTVYAPSQLTSDPFVVEHHPWLRDPRKNTRQFVDPTPEVMEDIMGGFDDMDVDEPDAKTTDEQLQHKVSSIFGIWPSGESTTVSCASSSAQSSPKILEAELPKPNEGILEAESDASSESTLGGLLFKPRPPAHDLAMALDSQTQKSLRSLEGKFIQAALEGGQALAAFNREFSLLRDQVSSRQKTSSLDDASRSLVDIVSRNIAVLGRSFVDIDTISSSISSRLIAESEALLDAELPLSSISHGHSSLLPSSPSTSRLPQPSLQSLRHPTVTPITSAISTILPTSNSSGALSVSESSRSTSNPNPLPEFIEHAYKFFVANIFNPYPTREEKQAIVDKTSNSRVTLTSVSNWFTNARRRCGWTEILKRRCDGNRDQMVDLATRVFIKPDPHYPIDPQVVTEMMKMKDTLESMYERKTRPSAWIQEIEEIAEFINPIPEEERRAMKKREMEAEREARKRQREMSKEQRDLERQKRKTQAEALRKAKKIAKLQTEQEKRAKKKNQEPLFIMSYPPTDVEDEESSSEPRRVAGGKRKLDQTDSSSNDSSGIRHVSPAYSLSSSLNSDLMLDGRVPSLTWSESGDEQRPYKRSRSSSSTPYTTTPSLSPALEIPASFDYSFTFDPPTGVRDDPVVYNSIFDFSRNTMNDLVATPPRGQKRRCNAEDEDPTPRPKRVKAIVAAGGPDLAPAPSAPLFSPPHSATGSPTDPVSRRSSFAPIGLETASGLGQTSPPSVQNPQSDATLPFDIGVFDWSTCPNPAIAPQADSGTADTPTDFAQLFQLIMEQQQPLFEISDQTEQRLGAQLEIPPLDLSSDFLLQEPALTANSDLQLEEGHNLDFSSFMSGFMSDEIFNHLDTRFPESIAPTPDLSQSSSLSQAWTPIPMTPSMTPSETPPTPAELAEKAMNKERKRRELAEKKAALERERARLAELERELDDDD